MSGLHFACSSQETRRPIRSRGSLTHPSARHAPSEKLLLDSEPRAYPKEWRKSSHASDTKPLHCTNTLPSPHTHTHTHSRDP